MSSKPVRFSGLIVATALGLAAAPAVPAAQPAQVTRTIPWHGDDSLTIILGSDVVYTQGSRAGVTVTGDREVVEHVVVRDGKVFVDSDWAHTFWERNLSLPKVRISVTAPGVERFVFNSGGSFAIENYDQDQLSFTHNGGGSARVSGAATSLHYVLNGGASVDLSRLATDDAQVVVNGRGDLRVGASQSMSAVVNGAGTVTVLNTPARFRKRVNGSGKIVGA